jgi:beta-1,4-mannosyltransferase
MRLSINADAALSVASKPKGPIAVAFTPTWPENPYHSQLILHLRDHRVNVLVDGSLKQYIRQIEQGGVAPDIIHLHAIPSFSASPLEIHRLGLHLNRIGKLRKLGVKFVLTVHDLVSPNAMLPFGDLLIGRLMSGKMDALHVHSRSAKTELVRAWQLRDDSRISVIYHPSYIGCYSNAVTRSEARRRLNYSEAEVVFLFLGHVRPYKGVDTLLTSFANLPGERFRLLIAGDIQSNLEGELRRRCQLDKRIQLIGDFIPDADIQLYMNACDVVVLPYRRAFTSGAAVLAMSFGKPCVATSTGAFPEILDSRGAFFCTIDDSASLTAAMSLADASRSELPAMGGYNLERISQWRWAEMAERMAEMYASMLD